MTGRRNQAYAFGDDPIVSDEVQQARLGHGNHGVVEAGTVIARRTRRSALPIPELTIGHQAPGVVSHGARAISAGRASAMISRIAPDASISTMGDIRMSPIRQAECS